MVGKEVRTRSYEKSRSSIFLKKEAAATLREIAASLGFTTPTGPSVGVAGSNSALLEAIATVYAGSSQEQKNEFLAEMRNLLKLG